jgi:uncharacterized BrkB/YihY/UPF0761 family membrane protein
MFPLILGLLAILGLVVHDPGIETKFSDSMASIFPGDARGEIVRAIHGVKQSAGLFGLLSIAGLLWSGTSLFASMEFALTKIFETTQRDLIRQRLMGLIMMVIFLTGVVATVAANSATAASVGLGIAGSVAGAVILAGLLVAVYRFVPNRTFTVGQVWPGAVLAGLLIEVFSLVFPLYAKVAHGFNTYGQQFALFFVLATWLTFMCQFILLGAVFNKMRLGAPTEEGVVATPPEKSRSIKEPGEAIADLQGEQATSRRSR